MFFNFNRKGRKGAQRKTLARKITGAHKSVGQFLADAVVAACAGPVFFLAMFLVLLRAPLRPLR